MSNIFRKRYKRSNSSCTLIEWFLRVLISNMNKSYEKPIFIFQYPNFIPFLLNQVPSNHGLYSLKPTVAEFSPKLPLTHFIIFTEHFYHLIIQVYRLLFDSLTLDELVNLLNEILIVLCFYKWSPFMVFLLKQVKDVGLWFIRFYYCFGSFCIKNSFEGFFKFCKINLL